MGADGDLKQDSKAARIERIAVRHLDRPGALLPILHDVQAAFGHVPRAAVPVIAHLLNLSRAEVHGVITFYHDFRETPPQRPIVKLCRAEACQARGVDRLVEPLERDPRITVESVYCLGLCASGPAAMIGDRVFGRLDEAGLPLLALEAVR
jgi:formate dehydrogenase subunit gamma